MHFFILFFVNDCICVNKCGMNSKFNSVETLIGVIRVSQTWKLNEKHGRSPKLLVLKRWKIPRLNLWAVETNPAEPSSTLSTWRLIRPLMKLDASWALPVYPVLKAQSHERRCANILQKDRAPIKHSNFRVVKTKLSPKNHHVPTNTTNIFEKRWYQAQWKCQIFYPKSH